MTRAHGADIDAQRSSLSVLLVLSNRVLSTLVAAVVLVLKRKAVAPTAPVLAYTGISASNVFATTCQYEALLYVSFPVQTLGKCAKMIPVMIWSTTLYGKAYQVSDYLVAVGVMAGCALFATFDTGAVAIPKQTTSDMYGMILMIGYLCFDGLNTTLQEKLCSGYRIETFKSGILLCNHVFVLAFSQPFHGQGDHFREPSNIALRRFDFVCCVYVQTTIHSLHHSRVWCCCLGNNNDDKAILLHLTVVHHLHASSI